MLISGEPSTDHTTRETRGYARKYRRDRIDACLDHTNCEVRLLADFDDSPNGSIYRNDPGNLIRCGKLRKAETGKLVSTALRWFGPTDADKRYRTLGEDGARSELVLRPDEDLFHRMTLAQAKSYEEDAEVISCEPQHVIDLNNHLIFVRNVVAAIRVKRLREEYDEDEKIELATESERAQQQWVKEATGLPAEIVHIETDGKEQQSFEPEFGPIRSANDEKFCGNRPEGHDHIIDESRETNDPLEHSEIQVVRELAPEDSYEKTILFTNPPPAEKAAEAEKQGIDPASLQRSTRRLRNEATAISDGKIPDVPLTDEQRAQIETGQVAYALVNLKGYRWYRLDLRTPLPSVLDSPKRVLRQLNAAKLAQALSKKKGLQRAQTKEFYARAFHPRRIWFAIGTKKQAEYKTEIVNAMALKSRFRGGRVRFSLKSARGSHHASRGGRAKSGKGIGT